MMLILSQFHAHQQKLNCPQCHKFYPTLGGLVYHIESEKCITDFQQKVECRTKIQAQMQAARNFVGSRTAGDMNGMNIEPMPALRNYAIIPETQPTVTTKALTDPAPPKQQAQPKSALPVRPTMSLMDYDEEELEQEEEEDLISFETPESIAKDGWRASFSTQQKPHSSNQSIPVPVSSSVPRSAIEPVNIIKKEDWPVVGHPSPVTSSSQVSQPITQPSMTKPKENEPVKPPFDPHRPDPNHPEFKASAYWIPFTQKYKCPWKNCKKTFTSGDPFISHLRSSDAHRSDKFQCHTCFDYFNTVAALAQHSSSQGFYCRARDTDQFDAEVDRLSAGLATVGGRWGDDTVKYVINKQIPMTKEGLENAHRAQRTAKADGLDKFWQNTNVEW